MTTAPVLKMGQRDLQMGGAYLGNLREATHLMNDPPALRERMDEDGYLLIRKLHDPEKIKVARRSILENLAANGRVDESFPLTDGVAKVGARGGFLGGIKTLTHTPEFLNVVESPELMQFFGDFLGGPALTFDYKWLRVMQPGDNSGAHYDVVYMGRGTHNLFTLWTPLGDVSYADGPLAILAGSHRLEKLKETYGNMDVDRDKVRGSFSDDPVELVESFGGQWQTAEFEMGDALIFSMFTMHGSINNASDRFRISCDTRYQRADEPVDERWIGDNPTAHYAWQEGPGVDMAEARRRWGV